MKQGNLKIGLQLLAALFIISIIFNFSSCRKKDDPEPVIPPVQAPVEPPVEPPVVPPPVPPVVPSVEMKPVADFPLASAGNTKITMMVSFTLEGKGYVVDQDGKVSQYDPVANTWTPKKDFPATAQSVLSFALSGRGYIINASNSPTINYEYDPTLNEWKLLTGSLPILANEPYTDLLVMDNKVYVSNGVLNKYFEGVITPGTSITWTEKFSYPNSNSSTVLSFSIGKNAYVGGGYKGNNVNDTDFWHYNLTTNEWKKVSAIPTDVTRNFAGFGFAMDINGYYLSNKMWQYSPASDKWTGYDWPVDKIASKMVALFVIDKAIYLVYSDKTCYKVTFN